MAPSREYLQSRRFKRPPAPRKPPRPWLRLLRLPNLLTVPGDTLAGLLLASDGRVLFESVLRWPAAAGASLFLYIAGLALNDLADRERDRQERPDRPLVSGAIRPWAAWILVGASAILALSLAYHTGWRGFSVALLLGLGVAAYNFVLKSNAVLGPAGMGLCRALNVMLGAALAPPGTSGSAVIGACAVGLYVAGVTWAARRETQAQIFSPRSIGFLLSLLLPFQATLCWFGGAPVLAVILALLWPAHRLLSRRYEPS